MHPESRIDIGPDNGHFQNRIEQRSDFLKRTKSRLRIAAKASIRDRLIRDWIALSETKSRIEPWISLDPRFNPAF